MSIRKNSCGYQTRVNVPVERLAETGSSLILGARPVRVEDMYVDQAASFLKSGA